MIEGGIRCKAGTAMGACSLAHGDVISVGVVPLLLAGAHGRHLYLAEFSEVSCRGDC